MFGKSWNRVFIASVLAAAASVPAQAAGDLLVAPTRVVLDSARGTEVIVNNIGAETATYRISLVLRRMKTDGTLEEIDEERAIAHGRSRRGHDSTAGGG